MQRSDLKKSTYADAILVGFKYLLENYPEVFVIGQGLWSPWYVGDTMTGLEKQFGAERVIDTPVSEAACTGAAVGASLAGMKAIVVHPRMDFMLYAMDPIVNQAAKWSHMFGGQAHPSVTFRGIINRGGEQGAQHSQALHAWFSHVPGLRVVMPSCVADARDLLIAAVLCPDPVVYIDDRWLYEQSDNIGCVTECDLKNEGPKVVVEGNDVTIVGVGFATHLGKLAAQKLLSEGVFAEVIDVRVLNPLDASVILRSVKKTGRVLIVDVGCVSYGFSGEMMAKICENLDPDIFRAKPSRLALTEAPAPTSPKLEAKYYYGIEEIITSVKCLVL